MLAGLLHASWDIKADCKPHTVTLEDYGSRDGLLAAHGIAVPKILAVVSAPRGCW
jgi:hypothetical protein